ncbi:TIR domain-containing protein [Duganella aceris]|uniref:Cyclic nucleotide-binding domain-containing protein n=1 Tax=Duganella aceris TaxID=2703883 RepID=A0ABX0FVZ0_9BURK|nr:TIR domain-containing protein [Duganella aceris]NGZ88619.1 cyclic nucleotide-binding domain-containing protein [Duganella aceris]
MLNRFQGEDGRRLRVEALLTQKMVGGNRQLAEQLAEEVELRAVEPGEVLINQGDTDNDVFMIFAGRMDILVNGRVVNRRQANDHVGEMAAVEPLQKRAATVLVTEAGVVAKISEAVLSRYASRYPEIYRCLARELARRLEQRNAMVSATREKVRVFIISSAECRAVGRTIQNAFAREPFTTVMWTDDVFKVANYTLQSLEDEVDKSDFAIAIAHADDVTESRGKAWPAPRDNVIFELGLFMGRLGKERAILMEPRDLDVKLPSDLTGITTIPYRYAKEDTAAIMAPACNALRDHIMRLGPNN